MRRFLYFPISSLAMFHIMIANGQTRPTIGAIRWDPWYNVNETATRVAVEASLSPPQYQGRAPSCATVIDKKINTQNCGTRSRIDYEIDIARDAGLDYWAFGWYGIASPVHAWELYKSSQRPKINWCMLFFSYTSFRVEISQNKSAYVAYLKQNDYQKVMRNRPLIYIMDDRSDLSLIAPVIKDLRAAATKAGLGFPYIVLMTHSKANVLEVSNADAIGTYTSQGDRGDYAALASIVEKGWTLQAETGQSVVPTAMTGWDRRPRIEHPVPWEMTGQHPQIPFDGMSNYYSAGTPAQISAHIANMLRWLEVNSGRAPANTGLIYSWDEHDEGGSTLNPTLGDGDAILKAFKSVR